jgi:MerR HTH family regulatory protein
MKLTLPFLFSDENRKADLIHNKQFSVSATGETYRTINFWESSGLIDNNREESSEWRKFTFLDIVWIMVIKELTDFGYPIKKTQIVKENLCHSVEGEISLLVEYLYSFQLKSYKVLIVYNDGTVELNFPSKITSTTGKSYLCINVFNRLLNFVNNDLQKFGVVNFSSRTNKPK